MATEPPYARRVVDDELDELAPVLPAISIEGAKAVGKTATASQRVRTIHRLDDPAERAIAEADPSRLLGADRPVLIDEWQRLPESWDVARRAVDDAVVAPGDLFLTGSASPIETPTHSGAGRIVSVRMRPVSLAERGLSDATVSLRALLEGENAEVLGRTEATLDDYVREILSSGFPGLRGLTGRALRAQLDGYVTRIVERDFEELGHRVRNPAALRRWLTAYAAASSTTTSFEKLRDAATSGEGEKPSKDAVRPYRDVLERLWVIDPVPAFLPTRNRLRRISSPPKHQLVDPALAARLLGVDEKLLLSGESVGPPIQREGTLLGALFESLATLDVRVYAQASEATVSHLRTAAGEHEVDLIVERGDGRVVGIEVKLARDIGDSDVRHLRWLKEQLGKDLVEAAVISTGPAAYRRNDGIAVIPLALLGP